MTGNSSIDISLTNVWRSYRRFRKGKKLSPSIIEFEIGLMDNIVSLCEDLQSGRYKHGPYSHMIVSDRKRRDIAVAAVRDRVVHRLLYDYMIAVWDRVFIYDAWSCRPDKGLHLALARAGVLMRRHENGWVWRADITKLFDNVHKAELKIILRRRIQDKCVLRLLDEIIDSYCSFDKAHGIPIGNLTSQIFANIYLNEFDRHVVHMLKPPDYMRYGDDWLYFASGKTELEKARIAAGKFLNKKLSLYINKDVDVVKPVKKGISYLGADIWPNGKRMDNAARHKIFTQLGFNNVSSYRSLQNHYPSKKRLDEFSWLVMDRLEDEEGAYKKSSKRT